MVPTSCMLRGTAQQMAQLCDEDPRCRIIIFLPSGWDYLNFPLVSFKGGSQPWAVNTSNPTLNQNAISFLKREPPPPQPQPSWVEVAWELLSGTSAAGGQWEGRARGTVVWLRGQAGLPYFG